MYYVGTDSLDSASHVETPHLLPWTPPPSLRAKEPAHQDIVGRIECRRAHSPERTTIFARARFHTL